MNTDTSQKLTSTRRKIKIVLFPSQLKWPLFSLKNGTKVILVSFFYFIPAFSGKKVLREKVNSVWTRPNIFRRPRLQTLRIFPLVLLTVKVKKCPQLRNKVLHVNVLLFMFIMCVVPNSIILAAQCTKWLLRTLSRKTRESGTSHTLS